MSVGIVFTLERVKQRCRLRSVQRALAAVSARRLATSGHAAHVDVYSPTIAADIPSVKGHAALEAQSWVEQTAFEG